MSAGRRARRTLRRAVVRVLVPCRSVMTLFFSPQRGIGCYFLVCEMELTAIFGLFFADLNLFLLFIPLAWASHFSSNKGFHNESITFACGCITIKLCTVINFSKKSCIFICHSFGEIIRLWRRPDGILSRERSWGFSDGVLEQVSLHPYAMFCS